jgi:hypothetical protein
MARTAKGISIACVHAWVLLPFQLHALCDWLRTGRRGDGNPMPRKNEIERARASYLAREGRADGGRDDRRPMQFEFNAQELDAGLVRRDICAVKMGI